jgi:hypothetical protein
MFAKWTGVAALAGVLAIALLSVGRNGAGHADMQGIAGEGCSYVEAYVPCVTPAPWGLPIGDGLFVTSMEDFI